MPPMKASLDKVKKPRHRHSAIQLAALNALYEETEHPSLAQRTSLAQSLGLCVIATVSIIPSLTSSFTARRNRSMHFSKIVALRKRSSHEAVLTTPHKELLPSPILLLLSTTTTIIRPPSISILDLRTHTDEINCLPPLIAANFFPNRSWTMACHLDSR